jgi:dihydrofolate reductase
VSSSQQLVLRCRRHGLALSPLNRFTRRANTCQRDSNRKTGIVNEGVTDFAKRLRAEKGKDIWLVGGAELVAAFLDSEQADEFIIHVIPKMIGEDIPLVAPRHRNVPLRLLASKVFPDGVVRLHYVVRK